MEETLAAIADDMTVAPTDWLDNPLSRWLLAEGWHYRNPAELVGAFGRMLRSQGYPLLRMRITVRTLHPQVLGVSFTWDRDQDEVDVYEPPYSILLTDTYLRSPYAAIFDGAGGMRRRLDTPNARIDFPILEEIRERGATDYVAMPFTFSSGQINAITLAADRPGGFSATELARIYDMLPALAQVFERHAAERAGRTLLETYLGSHAGDRVMDGLIKRGDAEDIHAVIWYSDLRDSTPLAESMPRNRFLAMLNEYFDCLAGAVVDARGEILSFIGDAVLAIFPITRVVSGPDSIGDAHRLACKTAVSAARDASRRMESLNTERGSRGEPALRFGLALHLGDVTYGNIGVPQRLQFTVIGPAANEAARLEGETKRLGRPVVASAEFARLVPQDWESLGYHPLRGVTESREIFALRS